MDKIATNNFIVTLRKDVQAAKSMVAGNLTRKIVELKKKLATLEDGESMGKIQAKIDKIHGNIKLLKTLDVYPICKSAILKPDPKYWDAMVSDSKASPEDILKARVISKNKIQKEVSRFRSEHKDCDEWLEEYFEFREKKRELIEVKKASRKPGGKFPKKQHNNKREEDGPRKVKFEKPHSKFNKNRNSNGPRGNNHNTDKPDFKQRPQQYPKIEKKLLISSNSNGDNNQEQLHPSWASKRREKELLKAALSGNVGPGQQSKRLILNKVES